MSSPAATYNIVCDQGKTLIRNLRYGARQSGVFVPLNNTGFLARMQVRKTIPATTVVLNLSTTTGEIVLGGANGMITVTVSATVMAALNGTYRYDLELVTGQIVYGVVRGEMRVRPEVTR
jgi:hypothetical protein